MILRRFFSAMILACFLAACHRHPRVENSLEKMNVEDWQLTMASGAANQFKDAFNNDTCEVIYGNAAANFRSQDSEEWSSECERLKTTLGAWRGFKVTRSRRCSFPNLVVCVTGPAEFEKGRTEVDAAFLLDNGRAVLFWLAFKQDDQHWEHFPPIHLGPLWKEPVPKKSPQDGIAS